MKTPLKPSAYLVPFTASLAVLGAVLLFPALSAPLAASSSRDSHCQESGDGPPRCTQLVEMEVRDVIPLREAQTHAVVLVSKDQGVVLPIFVDETSAVSIAFRLAHRQSPHPLAHDLLDNVVEEMGGKVVEARIDDVREQIYFGRVFIVQGRRRISLDARPSDSIAMALTRGAKIYATQKVLDEAGITREEIDRLRERPEEGPGVGGSGPPPTAPPTPSPHLGPLSGEEKKDEISL